MALAAEMPMGEDRIVEAVAAQLESQRRQRATQTRWYWASWLARLFVLTQMLQLGMTLVFVFVEFRFFDYVASDAASRPAWVVWSNPAMSILSAMVSIVVGVWAFRHCQFRAGEAPLGKRP